MIPHQATSRKCWSMLFFATFALSVGTIAAAQGTNSNPLFSETKVRNYLPHMTWTEVEQALTRTDAVIIPVGSIEQHGKHLPLGTDTIAAVETAKLIAQKADVLVAPAVFAGLSLHHMGFPGTIALSPETFEAVVYETAQSLIKHGFRKILFYNGHGGNTVSVANVIQRINQTTAATAFDLGKIEVPRKEPLYPPIPMDVHAGVEETSGMLYLAASLVDMSKAENPILSFPPDVAKLDARAKTDPLFGQLADSMRFRPLESGKKTSTREMSNTGSVTTGDIKTATAERGRRELEGFIDNAAKFIEEWRKIK
ncbi:MAG: creatininase family protein [Acidobacteria bacterium]|nr:creatininase family protein [Acidobacteriota bacterium]